MAVALLLRRRRQVFVQRQRSHAGGVPAGVEPAHVRQGALGVAANGDELGDDGDGDFFRRDGADVEADGRMDAIEELGVEAFAR